MSRPVKAVINLAALQHNLAQVKRYAPYSRIMAIIKADAYGHGLIPVAKALAESATSISAFGVACLEEAMQLREANLQTPIVLLAGFFEQKELHEISKLNLDIVLHDGSQLALLEQTKLNKKISVWLKVDTGMRRLGVSVAEASSVYPRLAACPWVADEIKLVSHFAAVDLQHNEVAGAQMQQFQQADAPDFSARSMAASAGILVYPEAHLDWVRPGLMLYGISPFDTKLAEDFGLKPVMTLQSQIIAIKHAAKGDKIGYNGTWVCADHTRIGVVAIGYGDGYPRHLKSGTPVLVNGKQASLIGRVSMDMITVDLTHHRHTQVGDCVTLWGEGLPVEIIASYADTIPYTLITGVKPKRGAILYRGEM